MRVLDQSSIWIGRLAMAAGMTLVASIAGIMLAQVVFRYVLNSSLQWSEELSVLALVWAVFIGSAVLVRGWQHIAVTAFVKMLPDRLQSMTFVVAKILTLLFLIVVTYYAVMVFIGPIHATSVSLGVSTRWAKFSLAVGGALMTVVTLAEIVRDIAAIRRGDRGHFAQLGEGGSL